jgi:predicted hotdog family 3-hydroxylacyl-ACP dehydratase
VLNHSPIGKAKIRRLIPHAGSMCLLDEVIRWDEDSIVCRTASHCDRANPLRRNGQLGAIHALEYAAQAIAIHGGLRADAAGAVALPGYLAAVRNAELEIARLDDIDAKLEVRGQRLFADRANAVYDCEVSAAGRLLAKARVTILPRIN